MGGYRLPDLLDLTVLQKLADAHYRAAGMPIGIVDAEDGSVLVGSGWQDICVKFHRSHPVTLQRCRESDDYIKERLAEGEACRYKCKNGLWDIGMPILVDGEHLATMFLGQFFYEGEIPDREFFTNQAREVGFDRDDYLAALDRVPVFSPEKVASILEYDKSLTHLIADFAAQALSRIRAHEAIRESERKFRSIFENAAEGIFQTTPDGRYLTVNSSLARMYGYDSPEEMIGAIADVGAQQYVDPEKRSVLKELYEKQGFVEAFEAQLYRKDGSTIWISMTARAVRDEDGKTVCYEGIVEDITSRKQTREALLESEEKYRTVVESAVVGVYIIQDGLFRFVNKRWCEMYGYAYDEVVDTLNPLDLALPEDRDLLRENLRRRLSGEEAYLEYEMRALRKDGRIITVHILGSLTSYRGLPAISGTVIDITEQKKAEEALRTSRFQLSEAMDLAKIVYWEAYPDQDHPFVFNDPFYTFFGTSAEQEGGYRMSIEEYAERFVHPDDRATFFSVVERVVAGADQESLGGIEHRIVRRDGEVRHVVVRIRILKDGAGGIIKVYGALQDITERTRMEETVLAGEARFRSIAANLPGIVFQYYVRDNGERGMYYVDGRAEDVFGVSNDPIEDWHRRFHSCIVPEDRGKWHDSISEAVGTSRPWDVEVRIIKPTGEEIYVKGLSEPVRSDGETVFNGILLDVTARKRAEEELRVAHQQLFDIIEFLPDATFVIDEEGRVVAWNLACEELTGVKKQDIIGKGEYAYAVPFYGERRPMLIDYVTMEPDDLWQGYTSVRKKGHLLYVEGFAPTLCGGRGAHLSGKASPLFDKTGKVVGAIESLRDITDFKRLEAHLSQAQKMEAIGTLAGGIAHDFNNILTVFTGYGTLLQMALDRDNPLRMYVDQMLSSAEKASQLTHGLLAFSRKQPITLRPLLLNDIVRDAEKLLQRLLTEDIELRTNLAPYEIPIMGDATQIDQILFNLAANARDAMPKGGMLTIETKYVDLDREFAEIHGCGEPGAYAVISVTDTGVGMSESIREHIFDPFFTTKEVGKGTGLGLSTVYGIVSQHNGYISVYSEPQKGTTFHIYLPATDRTQPDEKHIPAPVAGGNERILVAEDSEAVRSLMCRILNQYGYTTVEAVDGADAVERFGKAADRFDLLILDSVMPRKNGREAYDEIHRIRPDIKVIFTSGYTRDVFAVKGTEEKEFHFLQKPVSPGDLLRKVREVLDEELLQ